jgi:mercuric ion binding protein
VIFAAMVLAGTSAFAGQRTVTLAVDGMTCASCPYIVRTALLEVPGVERAEVSLAEKKAVVTFDDTKAGVADLTAATAAVGFPSRRIERQGAQNR